MMTPDLRRPIRLALLLLAPAIAATACADGATEPQQVASVVVSPATATLASRAPLPLTATARTAQGRSISGTSITWASSDTGLARVSGTGLVTAGVVVVGTPQPVTISAVADGMTGTAVLAIAPVPVATVTPSPSAVSSQVGSTQPFAADLRDDHALALAGRRIVWSSSDTSIATVDSTGLATLRPYAGGATRVVTLTAASEGRVGTATLTALPEPVASIDLSPDSVAVEDTRQLVASVLSAAGISLTGRVLTWTSSDTTVATVTPAGLVIPRPRWDNVVRAVTITATSEGVTDAVPVAIMPAHVATISFSPTGGPVPSGSVLTISSAPLSLSGVPLTGRPVAWATSDPAVATVDSVGNVTFTTNTTGTALPVSITGTAEGLTGSAAFSVLPSPATSLRVLPDSLTLAPNLSASVTARFTNGAGTTLSGRAVAWTPGDTSIITVTSGGVVTGRPYAGTDQRSTYLVASGEGLSDTIPVVVNASQVTTVRMTPSTLLGPVGLTDPVSTTLLDAAGIPLPGRSVSWTSSDPSIATVSNAGQVTVVGVGTATITATSEGVIGTTVVTGLPAPLLPASFVGGGYHTCGLTATGAAYCWGINTYGQLGNGVITPVNGAVAVTGGHTFQSLSAGGQHTCGLTVGGDLYCWGWNASGQLGDGTEGYRATPTLVVGGNAFAQVAAAWNHSCALTTAGEAYCWGQNNIGQVGDSSTTQRNEPTRVVGGHTFTFVIARYGHSCGLTPSGAAYCWGRNQWGAIGDGTQTFRTAPVPMRGGLTFTSMSLGWDHSCGIRADGTAHCLGRNQYGQLADGTDRQHLDFIELGGGHTWNRIWSGFYHLCGVTQGGVGYCWARNRLGEIGDGTSIDRRVPIDISAGRSIAAFALGYSHTCALLTSGAVHCWGVVTNGLLGDAGPPVDQRDPRLRDDAMAPRPRLRVTGS
ncbi:MAG: Ig-like domain-containing protein [Gemmatimonadetes bacterium]|nr:Ig-like domain-containing protein [Gemmatimonadota bacterium]